MTIKTLDTIHFELMDDQQNQLGELKYTNQSFDDGLLLAGSQFFVKRIAAGRWVLYSTDEKENSYQSRIRVRSNGIIQLTGSGRQQYIFRKSIGWKLLFSLTDKTGDDLLSLLPQVNWQKQSHDFILQLNEDYEGECNSLLILQALHCANISLSMMNGGEVKALVGV